MMFRIGEFSKIAQVSGRLLRFYDEIGLLSPDFIDAQTGYRYYSAQQLPRLNRILVLKELGLSLEQIAQFLERDASIDEIRGMLTLRKAQIEQTLEEETARLQRVESRLQQIDVHGQIQEPDVVLKSVSAQQFLSIREVLPDFSAVQGRVRRIATIVPAALGDHCLNHLAVLIHSPIYEPDVFDVEIGYLFTGKAPKPVRLSEDRTLTVRELPAVETMATLVHVGRVRDSHQSYERLATWLERNQWQVSGTGREMMMQLPQTTPDDEAVIELQLPARKAGEKLGA
jgi:DNA-binding transcriptional MerR regulator